MKNNKPKNEPTILKLRMKDWIRLHNGINALESLRVSLPLAVSLRIGVLQRTLEPKIEQYQKEFRKAQEALGFKEGETRTQSDEEKLEEALTPLWDEMFEEKFVKIDPSVLSHINITPGVAAALADLFEEPS